MLYVPGQYYHAYNRGAHRMRIFQVREDYRSLIRYLTNYSIRYDVTVCAYCLMPTHYHFILRMAEGGSIGGFLRTVFNAFGQHLNRRHDHSGTYLQGPAKVKWLNTTEYGLQAVAYIHMNPIAAGLARLPEEWEFSNYLEWIGCRESSLMDERLRETLFQDPVTYKEYVEASVLGPCQGDAKLNARRTPTAASV